MSPNTDYLLDTLQKLLAIASPSGFTDQVVHFVCDELARLDIPFELTRRGAIRATLEGRQRSPDRALVAHVDTLGAQVKSLKANGRLEVVPVGHWNARFAEGCRATLFSGKRRYRGSLLPLKASGHTFAAANDAQEANWQNIEMRVDVPGGDRQALVNAGIHIGDFIAIDTMTEIDLDSGFINSRHLDDKAGVAVLLTTAKALKESTEALPVDLHLLFTITEEVGSGASSVLHQDVAEMVSIDNGTTAPGQNSSEYGVTIAMADQTGPFDYHLTHHLIHLCHEHGIGHQRDIFRFYRSDSASAIEAGNDLRTALVCFGIDASHYYERIHLDALTSLTRLLWHYALSAPLFADDNKLLTARPDFPHMP
ncbi:osmoprotectant NAGGN system M42 family peptidase [Gallaecimonas pentaromativorans]|uniref:osmoprotectant NAGGN system M42 family peptidase n=1 Tax=Gallaecimonas pentaromativorans TaxID=584787 RepID=UPI003A95CEB6